MTSALELFYTRRSRVGRNSDLDSLFPVEFDRDRDHFRLSRRSFRRRLHHEDCEPSRRSPAGAATHGRSLCNRASQTERDTVRLDRTGGSESSMGNGRSRETGSSRNSSLTPTRNDRLPGTVLQARARLLERLRGISLTGNRQRTVESGASLNEVSVGEDTSILDSGDWEPEWSEMITTLVELRFQADISQSFGDSNKKPPGLSPEAVNSLPHEVFEDGRSDEGRASSDCCICLEKFCNGDGTIHLLCGHRFHATCLKPWVQVCGDCPYCRTCINSQ